METGSHLIPLHWGGKDGWETFLTRCRSLKRKCFTYSICIYKAIIKNKVEENGIQLVVAPKLQTVFCPSDTKSSVTILPKANKAWSQVHKFCISCPPNISGPEGHLLHRIWHRQVICPHCKYSPLNRKVWRWKYLLTFFFPRFYVLQHVLSPWIHTALFFTNLEQNERLWTDRHNADSP